MTISAAETEEALTEAYHAVFDAKDAITLELLTTDQTDTARMLAADACRAIASLMSALNLTPPHRFDSEGRPA